MSAQDILQRLVQLADREYEPEPWVAPDRTFNPAYSGGDCEKHGRFYGTCHSCRREQDAHYEDQRSEFLYDQRQELRKLADEARTLLNGTT